MAREVNQDFLKLKEFVQNYNISSSLENVYFTSLARTGHRRLLAFLTCAEELSLATPRPYLLSDKSVSYIAESTSDVAQALFCWLHGAYKPASLTLRSAIETFLKGVAGTESSGIFELKSVYEVFDVAKVSTPCGGDAEPFFVSLRQTYRHLCQITHTAKIDDSVQASSLGLFPRFQRQSANQLIEFLVQVVDGILAILLSGQRPFLERMHFRNRLIVVDALTKDVKKVIFVGDEFG